MLHAYSHESRIVPLLIVQSSPSKFRVALIELCEIVKFLRAPVCANSLFAASEGRSPKSHLASMRSDAQSVRALFASDTNRRRVYYMPALFRLPLKFLCRNCARRRSRIMCASSIVCAAWRRLRGWEGWLLCLAGKRIPAVLTTRA